MARQAGLRRHPAPLARRVGDGRPRAGLQARSSPCRAAWRALRSPLETPTGAGRRSCRLRGAPLPAATAATPQVEPASRPQQPLAEVVRPLRPTRRSPRSGPKGPQPLPQLLPGLQTPLVGGLQREPHQHRSHRRLPRAVRQRLRLPVASEQLLLGPRLHPGVLFQRHPERLTILQRVQRRGGFRHRHVHAHRDTLRQPGRAQPAQVGPQLGRTQVRTPRTRLQHQQPGVAHYQVQSPERQLPGPAQPPLVRLLLEHARPSPPDQLHPAPFGAGAQAAPCTLLETETNQQSRQSTSPCASLLHGLPPKLAAFSPRLSAEAHDQIIHTPVVAPNAVS